MVMILTDIGHFGFFNSRFKQKLWQVQLEWLKFGRVPVGCPGELVKANGSAVDL
jgi:hypothetical protein